MAIFFTADTHFGHANIIRYCNRPFHSIGEHDAALITNWNAVVRPADEVYVLGDFIFAKTVDEVESVTQRLNGRKYLIRGNHDRVAICESSFEWIKDYHEMTAHNLKFVLFHYPISEWNGWHRRNKTVHLYGHVHNHANDLENQERRINVGVDLHGFTPIRAKALASGIQNEAKQGP
jgi:calcineurin-like phosphoesterase family protein